LLAPLTLQAIEIAFGFRWKRLYSVLPCRREHRPPLRAPQESRLATGWTHAIEDKHNDRQHGEANGPSAAPGFTGWVNGDDVWLFQ
jgi:hypothetical protein